MNDRLKWRMWSTHAGRYFDETNDAMLENVFECMKQQICYDCQNPVFRKIYDRIAYNHIADGMVFEQCTGLKDKNGKLIYEGDIVRVIEQCMTNTLDRNYPMLFNEKTAKFGFKHPDGHFFYFTNNDDFSYEVIGNIHENTKLLENEDAKGRASLER